MYDSVFRTGKTSVVNLVRMNGNGQKIKVAILGAGIVGVTSAVRIIETVRNVDVTVLSHEFSPHTTGDGSAGLWLPYALGEGVSPQRLSAWCEDSLNFFVKIARSPVADEYGVGFLPMHFIAEDPQDINIHMDKLMGSRDMTEDELSIYPSKYKYGKMGTTVYAECTKLIPKLIEKIHKKGGHIERRKIHKLAELIGEYDVVVNCTGLQSAFLVPDAEVYPVRGQVVKVKAPWVKHCVMEKEFYIIPNSKLVTLGGTKQSDDWNTNVDNDDKERILSGTSTIMPSLKNAELMADWVGLRPARDCPRVERDLMYRNSTMLHVIHNYGHGGSGVTLSWGCAGEVVSSLQDIMKERIASKL